MTPSPVSPMTHRNTVRERPILMSGAMVRAILSGSKTQTRRVVKGEWAGSLTREVVANEARRRQAECDCPYGAVGDRLWVRETWHFLGTDMNRHGRNHSTQDGVVQYPADGAKRTISTHWEDVERWMTRANHARPSIHMPRWASRLTLEITGVRVERVQAISDADVEAEGIEVGCYVFCATTSCWRGLDDDLSATDGYCPKCGGQSFLSEVAQDLYANLWDSLNAKRGFGWDVNPWVWVIEFRALSSPLDDNGVSAT